MMHLYVARSRPHRGGMEVEPPEASFGLDVGEPKHPLDPPIKG